ncbi:hypothetical protein E5288_WYG010763 [Bos mutus]|uniref:Uncharacterized protein n=1 Tax=Bos mutus TaxID=72004 RepID=A0A6B0S486_9CETA|nr:hypothetical protein [Bos mutus]
MGSVYLDMKKKDPHSWLKTMSVVPSEHKRGAVHLSIPSQRTFNGEGSLNEEYEEFALQNAFTLVPRRYVLKGPFFRSTNKNKVPSHNEISTDN